MRLFKWFILRRLLDEPLRSVTTALGIALGVGYFGGGHLH